MKQLRAGGASHHRRGRCLPRSRGCPRAGDRRRNRADADDEGAPVPARAPRQPPPPEWRAARRARRTAAAVSRIGAMTTLTELERSPQVASAVPVVSRALRTLSNVRIRNVATLGGHLAHGDPHMDLPPILLTLGARVRAVEPPRRTLDRPGRSVRRLLPVGGRARRADYADRDPAAAARRAYLVREVLGAVGRRLAVGRRGCLVSR